MKKQISTNKKIVIFITVLIFCYVAYSSALPLLKWAYGIREPRIEQAASLLVTAKKYGLTSKCLVTVTPCAYRGLFDKFYHSIPEALIFDRNGRRIEYKKPGSDCNAGLFGFIPKLNRAHKSNAAGPAVLASTLCQLRDVQGHLLPATYLDSTADFYLMISWTAFTGKLNDNHVRAWQNLAMQNRQARIQVIEVNFDIQQWWPKVARDTLMHKWL